MSKLNIKAASRVVFAATLLTTALGGCAYDYLNHDDRVSFSAGNAVKANLARETTNPSKKIQNHVHGLGKDGHVVPDNNVLTSTP